MPLLHTTPGPAVHAFYTFHHSDKTSPQHISPATLAAFLQDRADCKLLPELTPEFLSHILFCWQYLFEMAMTADEYYFERELTQGGLKPDVLAKYHDKLFVLETKTILASTFELPRKIRNNVVLSPGTVFLEDYHNMPEAISGFSTTHGNKQVRAGIDFLRRATKNTVAIFGFVLGFIFFADGTAPQPVWKRVDHYVPTPSA